MDGNLIIKNASELVTCSGFAAKRGRAMSELGIIADGAVVIEQGQISRIGPTTEVMTELNASGKDLSPFETIDAFGKAVLPGFIDSHTHLVFGGYRAEEYAWRLKGDSYMDILHRGGGILSTVTATRRASREELTKPDSSGSPPCSPSGSPPSRARAVTAWIAKPKSNNWRSWQS